MTHKMVMRTTITVAATTRRHYDYTHHNLKKRGMLGIPHFVDFLNLFSRSGLV
jgi:hypothetical protein